MQEFDIIRDYFTRPVKDEMVRIGVGDDGAVLTPPPGMDIVCVVDSLVAGVHFPQNMAADDIGYRAVAVNLSDIAAMGARPRWMTLALTLTDAYAEPDWLRDFSSGLFAASNPYNVDLVGGDTTAGPELVVSIQVLGTVAAGRAIPRGGAQEGDDIYVTGTLGDAAAGLRLLQRGSQGTASETALVSRFCRPEPRAEFGERLVSMASAAIDVSDGLVADLGKLIAASKLGAQIDLGSLPLSTALTSSFDRQQCLDYALSGGDDYELCFTAPPQVREKLRVLAETANTAVHRIGMVTADKRIVCTDAGEEVPCDDAGYRHFAKDNRT